MTVETLTKQLEQAEQALEEYRKTINGIDDFFEYTNQSISDRKFIHERLDNLSNRLLNIYRKKDEPIL